MQLQPGLYRHYKGPQYRVFSVARHSETEEEVVFYQALYGDFGMWVRPLSMFLESVEVDGEHVPRFALVEAEPSLFHQREKELHNRLCLTSPCSHYI
ncbi:MULTISPECIES: DUF1653 domain-containing protein [Pseudomonas]|uniref:DUF1653 domain-containing protein n=3 Tax=Pseudomonas savastanoi TaxID=29438 RepID=A0A0P9V7V1_PSESS|nr:MULTISPECIES: DUF1653 domain-containing protein [Pseudomonas]ARD11881.1 TonB box-like protein [Pseudomonas savastanoi pv. savastanoi NCPPB 3335]KPB22826.1 hypothetical protein AC519_3387 [Pseudomonas savastanoi]KPX97822.1 Uncharacterized protein ALO61_03085 [Pseudomonas savastanoi pv. nerii]KPY34784.1 Uncharacterized protein ALO49_00092 [Pseudomonas savastanoi pv. retacarpa]KPY75008.1 Uncharacterized protein ALO58_03195 [Pseudomonas savastanoi pv. savastanoi]